MNVIMLELNEVNFDHIREYVKLGKLPNFGKMLEDFALILTTSEEKYEELEPWIQWVTAHTGLSLAEHEVFRLGDIVDKKIPQIWDVLESRGLKVGAISPMNASNSCRSAEFFLPDPWTRTGVTGSALLKHLSAAISQAVNDNANGRVLFKSLLFLTLGLITYGRPSNYPLYVRIITLIFKRRPWAGALLLDQLFFDVFVRLMKKRRPNFASLFLNAGAHIQHHYMFNSAVSCAPFKNPSWYVQQDADPVLEVYTLYDHVVGQVREIFPDARLMLATGLHQQLHNELTFYWRLKDHKKFLCSVGVSYGRLEPRMSRDFILYYSSPKEAAVASNRLTEIQSTEGIALFEVDNRGKSLFVTLAWANDIPKNFEYFVGNEVKRDFRQHVAFVAIKNGEHNGTGYLIDTGHRTRSKSLTVPLASLPERIAMACGVKW